MSDVQAETVDSLASIWWLLVAVAICLPVCVWAFWRIGQWWVTDRPLPLPLDRAYPAVPFSAWAGVALFVGLQILSVLLAMVASALGDLGLFGLGGPPDAPATPALLVGGIGTLVAGLLALKAFGPKAQRTVGVRAGNVTQGVRLGVIAFAAILPVCVAALVVSISALRLVQAPVQTHPVLETVQRTRDPSVVALLCVQAVIVAPVVEEFLFRGLLMWALARATGMIAALVVSSVLFAVIHVTAEPQAVAPLFFLGMALGYVAYRTRSLVAPIIAHGLFNALMISGTLLTSGS